MQEAVVKSFLIAGLHIMNIAINIIFACILKTIKCGFKDKIESSGTNR
jgi:hypothetical protein